MKKFLKIYSFYAPVLAKNKKNMFLFTGLFMVGNVVANVVSPLFYKNIIDEASAQVTSGVFDFNVFLVLVGGLLVTLLFASIGRRLGSYFYSLFEVKYLSLILQQKIYW